MEDLSNDLSKIYHEVLVSFCKPDVAMSMMTLILERTVIAMKRVSFDKLLLFSYF